MNVKMDELVEIRDTLQESEHICAGGERRCDWEILRTPSTAVYAQIVYYTSGWVSQHIGRMRPV